MAPPKTTPFQPAKREQVKTVANDTYWKNATKRVSSKSHREAVTRFLRGTKAKQTALV